MKLRPCLTLAFRVADGDGDGRLEFVWNLWT
jgi:hypothetical protein